MEKQPPFKSKYFKFTKLDYTKKEIEEVISDLKRVLEKFEENLEESIETLGRKMPSRAQE